MRRSNVLNLYLQLDFPALFQGLSFPLATKVEKYFRHLEFKFSDPAFREVEATVGNETHLSEGFELDGVVVVGVVGRIGCVGRLLPWQYPLAKYVGKLASML
jgi:hypothetical protein